MARLSMHENLSAFLDMIAFAEGTKDKGDDGYNIGFGGYVFNDYSDHPREIIEVPRLKIKTTAAGRYQLLSRYFDAYSASLGLPDFSPESQDKIAIQQIKERKAIDSVLNGFIETAIVKCSSIWASLPGNDYGQPQKDVTLLLQKYVEYGGKLAK